MAAPQTNPAVTVPIPIWGLNKLDPLEDMDPRYSPWVLNWEPETQFLKVRGSYEVHADLSSISATCYASSLAAHDDELFAYIHTGGVNNRIYNVETGTPVLDHTTGNNVGDESYWFKHAGNTFFATESAASVFDEHRYYNGSAWAATTITQRINKSFKGRLYIASNRTINYTEDVGGLTGTTLAWNIGEVFESEKGIAWIGKFSGPTSTANEDYLAVGLFSGKILVYKGDFPRAANWEIAGRFFISPPLFYN